MQKHSEHNAESTGTAEINSFDEQYKEIALNCFRYLDFKSFAEVDRITMAEYILLMEAVRLKQVDLDYRNHLQAWLNRAVKAEKKSGKNTKPVYTKFKQFFDYEKAVNKIQNKGNEKSRFAGIGKLLNKHKGENENG